MNYFAIIRRSIWCILLAACLVISLLYLTLSSTLLTRDGLRTVVRQSHLADTVRTDILLPRILQTTRASDYATLLDDATIAQALGTAVSTEALDKKLEPAVDAIGQWLNSKEPSVTFSIDMSSVSDEFADAVAKNVTAKLAKQPACTTRNSYTDAATGVCQSSLVSKDALLEKITTMIQSDQTLKDNMTLTPTSTGLASALKGSASDLPAYLNMLYAASLVTTAIALLIGLWLLVKHRLAGIVTIGVAGSIAAGVLYGVSIVSMTTAGTLSSDPQLQLIARSGVQLVETTLQSYALMLLGGSLVLCSIGVVGLVLYHRHHAKTTTMSLSSPSSTND